MPDFFRVLKAIGGWVLMLAYMGGLLATSIALFGLAAKATDHARYVALWFAVFVLLYVISPLPEVFFGSERWSRYIKVSLAYWFGGGVLIGLLVAVATCSFDLVSKSMGDP